MARYLIESPHTPEECQRAVDELLEQNPGRLASYDFGCEAGVHTCWCIEEASSESAARNVLPSFLRSKARIVALNKYTAEQIRASHQAAV